MSHQAVGGLFEDAFGDLLGVVAGGEHDAGCSGFSGVAARLVDVQVSGEFDEDEHEAGFAAVNAHGGVSVLVGPPRASAAHFSLAGPAEVHAWIGATP